MRFAFGNDPAKLDRYRAFWNREAVSRPLIGFTFSGWFPMQEFAACSGWGAKQYLELIDIRPEKFLPDHLRLLEEGNLIADDLIRGACPGQGIIPWSAAILGCRLRVLPDSILGEERQLGWDEALSVALDPDPFWLQRYFAYADALVGTADGRFPVSHSPELGPSDLFAVLRGHTQSILDLSDEPILARRLLWRSAELFETLTRRLWERLPLFHGGYFDAQYCLWSPGPIARLQEDGTANYSPQLYRQFLWEVDRSLAARFSHSFLHLHSTSMHVLDAILAIESLRCLQINLDVAGPPLKKMLDCFQRVQQAGRSLLVRGALGPEQLALLLNRLDPRGLFLLIMVRDLKEVKQLREVTGM